MNAKYEPMIVGVTWLHRACENMLPNMEINLVFVVFPLVNQQQIYCISLLKRKWAVILVFSL